MEIQRKTTIGSLVVSLGASKKSKAQSRVISTEALKKRNSRVMRHLVLKIQRKTTLESLVSMRASKKNGAQLRVISTGASKKYNTRVSCHL